MVNDKKRLFFKLIFLYLQPEQYRPVLMTMQKIIHIDTGLSIPKFEQIYQSVLEAIRHKKLVHGDQLPSINAICKQFGLARETVVKAFNLLKEEGVIESVHGKGFYISSTNIQSVHHIFVLFDTFSAYKEVLFYSLKKHFGNKAVLDIYFHHFNRKLFDKLIQESKGKYTGYIILPFDDDKTLKSIQSIPGEKLFLLDRYPKYLATNYPGVYQEFQSDVYNALKAAGKAYQKYQRLNLVFRNTITEVPHEIITGVEQYCEEVEKELVIHYEPVQGKLNCREAYIVIDDEDLVGIVQKCKDQGFILGKDIGIISYNETSLKKVIADGISVISADFAEMGRLVASMVLNNAPEAIKCPSSFIDRGSF